MKRNQRTVKLYDAAHREAARLSDRFGISMAAIVELGIRQLATLKELPLPPRSGRSRKMNARRALA